LLAPRPTSQAVEPHRVGCPRLLIQYIRSNPPYRRPFLHLQPEDAPCRGDRDRLITDIYIYICIHTGTFIYIYMCVGTAVAQWLRYCATNQKVSGSIPASVSGFFIHIKSFRSNYGPGFDSSPNRNEYQEHFLGVKAAGA